MLGAGLRPATVSRSRRRDGGDGATVACPQRTSGDGAWAAPSRRGMLVQVDNLHLRGQFRLKCEPYTNRVYSDHPRTQELR
jgi:hypothetical protein